MGTKYISLSDSGVTKIKREKPKKKKKNFEWLDWIWRYQCELMVLDRKIDKQIYKCKCKTYTHTHTLYTSSVQ